MFVFVSDLHLGDGGPLEDFALWPGRLPRRKTPATVRRCIQSMHRHWTAFVSSLLAHAHRCSEPLELVLLGDVFDLLQVEGGLCDPEKITRIVLAHKPWFDALGSAERRDVAVTLVVGNHDHELLDPVVWERLLMHLPFLNQGWDSRPLAAWRSTRLLLHAEHGSQFDSANAVGDFRDPRALSLGSHIVLDLLNAFEPRCPLLDLMPDVPTALWYALAHAPGLMAQPLREFLFKGTGPGEVPPNLDFLPELENLLHRVWLRQLPKALRRHLRTALSLIASALGARSADPETEERVPDSRTPALSRGPLHPVERIQQVARARASMPRSARQLVLLAPEGSPVRAAADSFRPRAILTGHTHRPGIATMRDGTRWINTGSWKARACPVGSARFAIEQPLDAVVVRETPTAEPDVSLFCLRDNPRIL